MTSWHKNLQQAKQKNINFNRLFEICIIVILFLAIAYFLIFPTTHNVSLIRLVWIPGFILTFVSCIICISQQNNAFEVVELFAFLLLAAIAFGGCIMAGLDINCIFSSVSYLIMLMAMWLYSGVKISKRLFDFIYYAGVVLTLIFLVYSFTPIATKALIDNEFRASEYFTFNLDNANVTGTYLYGIMCILVVNFYVRKYKALNFLLIAIDFYFIYRTNSRSCIIAAAIVLIFSMFTGGKKKLPILVIILAWLVPIIFIFVYLHMYNTSYEDVEILNKSLFSGREMVFVKYMDRIDGFWEVIFGDLKNSRFQNAHNAPLAIYCSVGIIGAVISEILILLSVLRINTPSKVSGISALVIVGYFIHSCAEANMFMGGFPGSVFMIVFYLLANYSEENQNDMVLF